MLLSDVFGEQSIVLDLESRTKDDAFMELIETIAAKHPELGRDEMLAVIREREGKMNTSVTSGVAVPHGCYPGMNEITGAIGISREGIEYGAPDKKPVHCIFLIVMGESCRERHLHVLNRVAALINSGAVSHFQQARDPVAVQKILSAVHL